MGTGRVILPIARLGYQITGLDILPKMLEQARRKSAGLPEALPVAESTQPRPERQCPPRFGAETQPAMRLASVKSCLCPKSAVNDLHHGWVHIGTDLAGGIDMHACATFLFKGRPFWKSRGCRRSRPCELYPGAGDSSGERRYLGPAAGHDDACFRGGIVEDEGNLNRMRRIKLPAPRSASASQSDRRRQGPRPAPRGHP